MKILIISLCASVLFGCNKVEPSEILKEASSLEISHSADSDFDNPAKKRIKTSSCEYQLFGFADFPFQSNVINGIDYPFCTNQLCVLLEGYDINPYFSISSSALKICETGFEHMNHHSTCSDFEPIQITYLNYTGGTELNFFFQEDFWNCFFDANTYPGMEFQIQHGSEFI